MNNYQKLRIFLTACIFIPNIALANCPQVNQVTYKCIGENSARHCNWMAPWWDGYHGDAEPGDHPAAFKVVFWGATHDPLMGSTNCFYTDHKGNLVELSQNNWGGIPIPTSYPWHDGVWPSSNDVKDGKVCTESVEACVFAYG
ncbi:MAG: hypothetical protein P4M12_10835 [Gammaproteobacteria bacterium]|nr:hypothetical protein [Gammaproteobacteria bacterium]